MPIRVRIRNFQSLRNLDLELQGFTVITGPSNLGKSAVVRAMSAALFGILGDYFITDRPAPEDQCAVSVVDEKTSVKWWKVRDGKNSPTRTTSLEVNGTKYTKFGREQAQLTKDLGFVELEVAGAYIRPQIAGQFDPIFLLSGSETEAAEVLRLLGRVDVVTEAQRLSTKDAREQAQKLKIRKDDNIAAQLKALELEWVPASVASLSKLTAEWSSLKKTQQTREQALVGVRDLLGLKAKNLPTALHEAEIPVQCGVLSKVKELISLRVKAVPASLSTIEPPLNKIARLAKIAELAQANKEYYASVLGRQNCDRELLAAEVEKSRMEKSLGKCPTCSRTF